MRHRSLTTHLPTAQALTAQLLTAHVSIIALLAVAMPALGAEIEGKSSIDQVTVYPDGATVTRIIRADLPAGHTTLIPRDFPPTLDPASLSGAAEDQERMGVGARGNKPP